LIAQLSSGNESSIYR